MPQRSHNDGMVEFPASEKAPRCLGCNYVLIGLPEPRCPECGREFDPEDAESYTFKPPYVRWKFWLPPLLMVAIVSGILVILLRTSGVGVAATIVAPFALGGMLGYAVRGAGKLLLVLIAGAGLFVALGFLVANGFTGLFCGLVLLGICVLPVLAGLGAGVLLRWVLKRTAFSQRWHLPIWFFAVLPLVWAWCEGPVSYRYGKIHVTTTQIIDAPLADTWAGVTLYEDVRHPPPLLLRLGLSRPLHSMGSMTNVGDIKTCVYDQGRLVKRITRVDPGTEIAFEVIEQTIERCAARLKGGSFRFECISPTQTRVTLTTVYEPFLAPRFAWQPFEELSAHTLHRHVLVGMAGNAVHPQAGRVNRGAETQAEGAAHDHQSHP
jgi:hypothetical protein